MIAIKIYTLKKIKRGEVDEKLFIYNGINFSIDICKRYAYAEGESSDQKIKSSWYIGFGLGSGDGSWNIDGKNISFDDWSQGTTDKLTLTLNFGVGAILTPNFHLGGEISAISHQVVYETQDALAQINNYMLMLTYFPMETGLFIKGGAGLSVLVIQVGSFNESANGLGGLIGAGYYFWLGQTFNLGLNFDYSYQKYRAEANKPSDSSFYNLYVTCYWL